MLSLALCLLLSPNSLGAVAFHRGDFALAERLFLTAWEIQPHHRIASNLGAASRRLHKPEDAERWFHTAYTLRHAQLGERHPDTVIALNNRGVARRALGHLRDARADFAQALALVAPATADHASILANLSELALAQARLHEASRLCAQASGLHPRSAETCESLLAPLVLRVKQR